jgi:regulator of sigma E protease
LHADGRMTRPLPGKADPLDITTLIPSFGNAAFTIAAFVVALSVIVAIHEYGHYIVGRWSGIHAEVFSLGFGPVVYSRVDKRGTKWQLAALPFGGYVRFLGDSNAASGKDAGAIAGLSDAEKRHTMHGAPLWARAATVAAGPFFNFALSILVFAGIFLWNGIATDTPTVGTMKTTPFEGQSLLPGDTILAVNGVAMPDMQTFVDKAGDVPPASVVTYQVSRAGVVSDVAGPHPFPAIADGVQADSAAGEAGIMPGDVILTMGGVQIGSFAQMREIVGASDGKPLDMTVWRAGAVMPFTLTPRRMDIPTSGGGFETRWLMGLSGGLVFVPETRQPGPLEVMKLAVQQTYDVGLTSLSGIWHVVTGAISTCNLRGPIGIAETSGAAAAAGFAAFVWFIAVLSTAVGLMNLFPVPVLDGGHLVFHAWEAVTGKPPTERALRVLMGGGLAAILGLMVFALSNDLFCP